MLIFAICSHCPISLKAMYLIRDPAIFTKWLIMVNRDGADTAQIETTVFDANVCCEICIFVSTSLKTSFLTVRFTHLMVYVFSCFR